MEKELSASALRVQQYLAQRGEQFEVKELADSTRTAQEAADSIDCSVAQIAKSLVFEDRNSGELVLVIASGSNRVDTGKIADATDYRLKQAKANMVKTKTGYATGGIPPVGHNEPLKTFLDEDLKRYDRIWAAAGTPFAVFQLTPASLEKMTGGQWLDLRQVS